MEIKYVPLSFINTNEEILKQIKNTVLISYLFDQYQETTLDYYLDSTQYGYTASALESGKHKLVRITDINDGNVNWDTVPFCNCDAEDKYLLKDHDILVARTGGTTGKSFIVNNPPNNAVFASYLIRLRLNEKAYIEFITYFLNSYAFWSQIIEMKAGSAMPNVNAEKLKTLKLPKCDIKTQREIISIFKNSKKTNGFQELFDKVASVEQLFLDNKSLSTELFHQLTLVKKLRQQLLQDAVQGKLVPQEPGNEPAGELLKKIKAEKQRLIKEGKLKKEKELPEIKKEEIPFEVPEGWEWCRLGEVTNYGSSPKAEPSDLTNTTWILDLEDIEKETSKLISKIRFIERNSLSTKSVFKKGDVLYSKLRPYLDKVIVADEDGVCTTEILPLKCYANTNPYYLRFALKRKDFISYVNSVTKGMKMPRLGTKEGELALIPLPPLSEQCRIVQKLEELMGMCEALEGSIRGSMEQNERLLQQVLREALRGGKVEEKIEEKV